MTLSPNEEIQLCKAVVSRFTSSQRIFGETVRENSRNILKRFDDFSNTNKSSHIALTNRVLSKWQTFEAEKVKENHEIGNQFNPLSFFKIQETQHSKLLGILLQPWESHGQGNAFLLSFLELIGILTPEKGRWNVTIEKGRYDILLHRVEPKSVVIIENKSNNADDQPNQIYRYWYTAIHKRYTNLDYNDQAVKDAFKILYLPSKEAKEPEEQSLTRPDDYPSNDPSLPKKVPLVFQTIDFNLQLSTWIASLKTLVPTTNIRLRTYLDFYSELCKSL